MTPEYSLDQLQKSYAQLAFVHQILTQRTQYFLDEVDLAKDAAATITAMANKISDDIKAFQDSKLEADPVEASVE